MTNRAFCFLLVLPLLSILSGCDWMPGKPQLYEKWKNPADTKNATALFAQNCIACHGGSHPAPSLPMNNPVYLAIIPQATMRAVIANGIPGTGMPAFAQNKGGPFSDQQLDILVSAIYSARPPVNNAVQASLPPYSAPLGDPTRGAQAYATYCASCHGVDGKGGEHAGSVVNPDYLSLVSDQYLRTIVIAGRPDLGMPNWKTNGSGKSMSNQDISDVVAWLASHRLKPGTVTKPASQPPPPTAP